MSKNLFRQSVLGLAILAACSVAQADDAQAELSFTPLDTYKETATIEDGALSCAVPKNEVESCAEISAYSEKANKIFVTNGAVNALRILDVSGEGQLSEFGLIDLSKYGGAPNSVAVYKNIVAVAVEADTKQENGSVVIFDTDGEHRMTIKVGALPDMLTFTPNGRYLLVANEGEPNDNYDVDPEGTISIINTRNWAVKTADFKAFNEGGDKSLTGDVRVFGPNASVAQDLEPEYIAVSKDSNTAWVALQENNAFAIVDIKEAIVTDVVGLGFKDHSLLTNAMDASNKDEGINIQPWPVLGMYQPDAIASITTENDETYIVTANEGDARDYDGFSEEVRVKDLTLDLDAYPNAAELQQEGALGRLKTTTTMGDTDGDGDVDQIYSYGGRSISIWDSEGQLVWDSGNAIARTLEDLRPTEFNSQAGLVGDVFDYADKFDNRSDDKGAEPESVTVGSIKGQTYAFAGLERSGGIIVFNVTDPTAPTSPMYLDSSATDVGPEGLEFIKKSGNKGWLMVTSEIGNTVSLWEVTAQE